MENMRVAPALTPTTAAFPKSQPLPWGSGNAGKPHRAAKFIARTKADATLAILCPRAAFVVALGHPAFNSMHVRSVQDLPAEGSSVDLQKYLQKTSSDCNKHKQQISWVVLLYKTPTHWGWRAKLTWEERRNASQRRFPWECQALLCDRVEVTLGLDVVHAHCTYTVLVTDQV